MEIEIILDGLAKRINVYATEFANNGDVLFLSEPQHINFYTEIKFNHNNKCHERYLSRGLLFNCAADALLFSKSFLRIDCA